MKTIQADLNEKLLHQEFYSTSTNENIQLQKCQEMALNFVDLENGIAVLSDLQNNKSYVYTGKLADELNIFQNHLEIESIWEDELFNVLNTDDVLQKHILELQFFQFIKTVDFDKRRDFCVISKMRLLGSKKSLIHKMFYFPDVHHKNVELALCLYHFDFLPSSDYTGMIINTADGSIIQQTEVENFNFLSAREKEILKMIQMGKRSKEIADILFISINTVNRHRQNILEKMRVSNTTEACTLASKLNWI